MSIDRRTLLGAAGALAAVTGSGTSVAQQSTPTKAAPSRAPVIDVHTHMYSPGWQKAVKDAKDPNFRLGEGADEGSLIYRGSSIGRIVPAMIDFDIRIKAMDEAKVDVALISLTAPNVFWGTPAQSAQAARMINDDFAAAQKKYDKRIRWMASLPWQNADDAIAELKRAKKNGAIGVCMLTNIVGSVLTAPEYRPIWKEIEAMDLPVFIHPTSPLTDNMNLTSDGEFGLFNSIGFMTETSVCFERMVFSGFLDVFPKLKLIACHGGGYIPYLFGRFDIMWTRGERLNIKKVIKDVPSSYRSRIWYDSVVYQQSTLEYLVKEVGADRVLYGSDYPFVIGDMKGILARVDALPPAERDAVRSGSALKIFDLDL